MRRWLSATRKRALTRIQPGRHPDLELPSLQNWEQLISIVYKPPIPWYSIVVAAHTKTGMECAGEAAGGVVRERNGLAPDQGVLRVLLRPLGFIK